MGNFAVLHNDQTHQRLEVKLRRELGDLVMTLLLDEQVEDILLNPDSSLWVKRMGRDFTKIGAMAAETSLSALSTIAAWRGTVLNHDNPILETKLPLDGSRFEGIVSPVVRNPVFAIRLRPRKIFSLADYQDTGILTTKDDPINKLRSTAPFLRLSARFKSYRNHPRRCHGAKKHSRCRGDRQRKDNAGQRDPTCVRDAGRRTIA